jgi:general secretion pathway protein D
MRHQSSGVGQASSEIIQPRKRRVALNHLNDSLNRSLRSRLLPLILGGGLMATALGDQPTAPGSSPATNAAVTGITPIGGPAAASQEARLAATQSLLTRAKTAIESQKYSEAVELYRRARVNAQPLPQVHPQVAALRQTLERLGVEAAVLNMPPTAPPTSATAGSQPQPLLLPQDATPMPEASPEARKQAALSLVAQGRAALERGDINAALRSVNQAELLGVPESAFAPGEPRVWQLALDTQSAARRSGIAPSLADSIQATGDSMVRQASGVAAAGMTVGDSPGAVANSLYTADDDQTKVQPAQATIPTPGQGDGESLYRQGMEALSTGDTSQARDLFVEAWKHEASMDLATRAQLKEKLTLLQPSRLPETGSPAMTADLSPIERAELESQAETRRIYREITAELARANDLRTSKPLDALESLQQLRQRVSDSKLDATASASMTAMVDRAINEQKQYVEANRGQIELDLANDAVRAQMTSDQVTNQRIDDEVASLVETFNDLMEQRRYPEAEVVAKKVGELSPGSSIAKSMFHTSRMGTRLMINEEISSLKEDGVAKNLLAIDRASVPMDPAREIDFGDAQQWSELSRRRKTLREADTRYSTAEKEIQRRLSSPVDVNYKGRPFSEVMQDLSAVTNIPIVLDARALGEMRVATDAPVTLELTKPISLQSAMNLILAEFELTYIIENDVLKITSHEMKRTRVYPKTYRVTDLITPIPNFTTGYEDGLAGALRAAYQATNRQADVQVMPVSLAGLAAGGGASLDPKAMAQFGGMSNSGSYGQTAANMSNPGAYGGGFNAFPLIDLIQRTIAPDTWQDTVGGPSTIAQYPQTLSLVISTTSEVHDQIAELFASLRKLQNLQVTIEVRFITLSDSFFEQIGVDFDISFDDNVKKLPTDDAGPKVTVGWDGVAGLPTSDFDIKLNNNFGVSPAFGAFDAGAGSTIGFAILSDIEAFFFLQAAQGDSRTNVLQAPKVTLFDGQQANINDTVERLFVTSIQPVVGDFAVAQQPIVVVLNEGTQLNVQAVVSDDKRFVRVTLLPYFSQIGEVGTFTYEGRRRRTTTNIERDPVTGEPINEDEEDDFIEGTTVQQPTLASTSISTTVSVPDGGTILLGGIKRMREGRNERGVPILSKIPYISRLFRNVAIGRDAQSLMMMVTPRIIIQEEEELSQTGFDPTR